MAQGRCFVIGDVHGEYGLLCRLLEQLRPREEDQLIFLGDYIDRGPDAWGVLKLVYGLARRLPGVVCLKGNHEAMLLEYMYDWPSLQWLTEIKRESVPSWQGGILQLQEAARQEPKLLAEVLQWLDGLPVHYERGGVHFSHAGCVPGLPLEEQPEDNFLWPREEFFHKYRGKELWLIGHTPVQRLQEGPAEPVPLVLENNIIMLDTGAPFQGGRLSCLELESGELYQTEHGGE